MKLPELKNRFQNKYVIRIIAGVLMVGMLGTSFQAYTVYAEKNDTKESTEATSETEAEDTTENEDTLSSLMGDGISVSQKTIGKDETVYVISDNTGKATETIVSDHLINLDDAATLKDASTLKDIQNVKGDETFTQSGNDLTWQADGNDIYYQGTSTEETPITQTLTYYLDGKEIAPDDLAGKSGKVTIRFDYKNNAKVGDVYVPFAAISGMILDDSFSDIEVTNGKVISDGNNNVVLGYALPGLKESLQLEDGDLDEDVNIPDYFEVTADVENFKLDMTMTMAVNAANYVSTDGGLDLSSVDDLLDTLTDATSQLEDGSAQLADGLDTLQSKMGEFESGVTKLQSGIKSYTDGASTLANGIGTLKDKSGALADGVNTLNSSAQALNSGISLLNNTVGKEFTEEEKNALAAQASATVAAQEQTIKDTVDAGVDAQASTIQSTVAAGVGQTFDAGLYDQVKGGAVSSLNGQTDLINVLKAGITPQVQQGFVAQVNAAMGTSFATYAETQAAYDGVYGSGAADAKVAESVNAQVAAVVDKLATSVADTTKSVSSQVAAGAAVSASKTVAENAAVSAAQTVAGQAAVSAAETTKKTVASSITATQANGYSLVSGMNALAAGTQTLADQVPALTSGINQLNDGASTLTSNNDTLVSGMNTLAAGTTALGDGVDQLTEGSHTLADGIVQFNEEGIQKIVNAYNGDIKDLVDRVQSVIDAGEDYQTYTDIADGVNGSVKFVYKTAAIQTAEEE